MGDDGGFCRVCKLFCTSLSRPRVAGELLSKPYKTYSRYKLISEHSCAKYHQQASATAMSFTRSCDGSQHNIKTLVSRTEDSVAEKRHRLTAVVKTLVSLARQGLALRGHRDEKFSVKEPFSVINNGRTIINGDVNKGNFVELLRQRADAGDTQFKQVANKRAQYYSPVIQNNLLDLLANQVRGDVLKSMEGKPFSLIADETTDASNIEQLCIAVRFLLDGKATEKFLTFVPVKSLKGALPICS